MRAYRISSVWFPVFSGKGAEIAGGRWNSPGRPVIYCAGSYALAMLERLVHARRGEVLPQDHRVVAEVPDDTIETAAAGDVSDWDSADYAAAQAFGDRWLDEARSAALAVPSVVTRIDHDLVLNPTHPRFTEITVGEERPVVWDRRLFAR